METFLSQFESRVCKGINTYIQNKMKETRSEHTHPPIPGIIKGCPYCEKYGNVLKIE